MADPLRLLFELNVDGRPAAAGLLRFRKDIEATIAAARRAVAQPVNTGPAATAAVRASLTAQQRAVDTLTRSNDRLTQSIARGSELLPAFQQRLNSVGAAALRVGGGLRSMGASMAILVSGPLLALGRVSGQAAADIDAIRNRLVATEGSLETANTRLAKLRRLADASVGVTRRTALDTFAILATLGEVTEDTINKQIRAFGRLNAAFTIDDQQTFFRNLVQIFQQSFEIKDIREALGRVPIFNQLLEQAFGTADPERLRELRASGKLTLDTFLAGMATAVETNPVLGRIQESISVRFAKTFERLRDSLEPLGLAILGPLERIIVAIEPIILRIAAAFNQLPPSVQTAIVAVGLLTAALGPVLFVLGGIASGVGAITTAIAALTPLLAGIGLPAIAVVVGGIVIAISEWVVILGALGLAWRANFLNIQGLVSDAANVVLQAFIRIRAVFEEAITRILPTLQSITTRVIGIITALWERYGATVVRVISTTFEVTVRTLEALIRFLGNVVDLVAKLIDGDWRGAWQAFSRIMLQRIDTIEEFFDKALPALARGFVRLHAFIIRQAVTFVQAGSQLAAKLVVAIAAGLITGAPQISDALAKMLLIAAADFAAGPAGGIIARTIINAMRKAAAESEGITIPVITEQQGLARIRLNPDGSLKTDDRITTPPPGPGGGSGADTETRRRIRLLELEAERAEAIARQRINAENIFFEQRKTSLKDFTDFQIKEEEIVLEKKKAVFAAERLEAEKLGKGRDLALGQIRLKELQAEIDFQDKRNQLLANQQREELEATKAHRQALLDIQEQADDAELARLEEFQRQGFVTAFDVASRREEIEAATRRRRREELETQLKEAGENREERQRILDDLKKFDAESAAATEDAERRKREALQETADAYRDYKLTILDALEATREAVRDAAAIALTRLSARVFLTERQRIERQFAIDKSLLDAEKRASDLRIENAEREAVEKAKRAGAVGEKLLEIEKTFNALRLAEQKRFEQEKRKLEEDRKAALERTDPNSTRSLFGDTFADFDEALRAGAAASEVAVSRLTVVLGSFGTAAAEHFANASAHAGNFISILLDGIDQIIAGLGDMLQNWVLLGETGSAAFRKLIASTLAYYAKTFLIKALDNVAEGFSNLAKAAAAAAGGNLVSAALYKAAAVQNFISAAKYGLAAAGTAIAGRFAAGDSFKQDTARRAVGGDLEPRNRTFSGQGVESSSTAAREGSGGGIFQQLIARVEQLQQQNLDMQRQQMLVQGQTAQALTRIQSMRHGDALAIGTAENPAAVGRAVIDHSNSDGEFNEQMQRNLGFAR